MTLEQQAYISSRSAHKLPKTETFQTVLRPLWPQVGILCTSRHSREVALAYEIGIDGKLSLDLDRSRFAVHAVYKQMCVIRRRMTGCDGKLCALSSPLIYNGKSSSFSASSIPLPPLWGSIGRRHRLHFLKYPCTLPSCFERYRSVGRNCGASTQVRIACFGRLKFPPGVSVAQSPVLEWRTAP